MITNWIPQFELLEQSYQQKLEDQYQVLDKEEIRKVYEDAYRNPSYVDMSSIREVPYATPAELDEDMLNDVAYNAMGKGEVAVLLMAGGQGTRLEHQGPKGTFSFEGRSLFELQANQLRNFEEKVKTPVQWYIMTSDINHGETLAFFESHRYFELDPANIHFFRQEHFPALSKDGELLITEQKDILLTPNGNGGIFSALKKSRMLDDMKARGIRHVFMNNVDNVVVKVADPLLMGLHIQNDNEVTSKSIAPKPGESVGRLCLVDGRKSVVEYTELPEGEEEAFKNGNIGIHAFNMKYLEKVADVRMPYHLALKKLEHMNSTLQVVREEVLKFEKFYFDAFVHADTHMTLQVDRKGEFSPLKNKVGKDSIETAYKDLMDAGVL
ncbi:UTP--glucose-1-phosphate uridylyltransferase [Salinicoccus sp. ID82-1]|uniref:UTP--glucose-1-phosphate uridylyltransferase n=1 Tax=Salinicoccus sp. ID82-1 TaxID=2820269 RepID=UPI001F007712|nr:UTP--glucose-1-phosphate uridylyltransferase [Salinicoccus sp. ID82-1]MCG1010311.1 UTP--glucose-1-phosphate uridylyltransferase [Salinicoccus sp. ID82-1]